MRVGLKKTELDKIQSIFTQFYQVDEVILYGSRAKGNNKPGSDIDITIKGKMIDLHLLNKIDNELDELNLPYIFDISGLDKINNPDLIEHIQRVGKTIYQRKNEMTDL